MLRQTHLSYKQAFYGVIIMKQIIKSCLSLLICALLTLVMAACGDNSSQAGSKAKSIAGTPSKTVVVNSDGSVSEVIVYVDSEGDVVSIVEDSSAETSNALPESTVGNSSNASTSKASTSSAATSSAASKKPQSSSVALPSTTPVITGLTPIKAEKYYGRSKLSGSKAMLAAYDKIAQGAENFETKIDLKDSRNPLKDSDIKTVITYYKADYPQHFWVGSSFEYTSQGKTVTSVELKYNFKKSELEAKVKKFNDAVKSILSGISGSWSQYERELAIHDRLAQKVSYNESTNAHSAYGALVDGIAVCEGYTRAFQYLCYQAGIECAFISGTSVNPGTNQSENHSWNQVKIDGKYYNVDVTWDDQDDILFHAYFNVTDAQIKKDHTFVDNYPLPSCTATDANYFTKTGTALSSYNVDAIANVLRANSNKGSIFFTNGADGFSAWFGSNHANVAKKLGLNGYNVTYSTLSDEVYIKFTTR